jgi:hypothetical protein
MSAAAAAGQAVVQAAAQPAGAAGSACCVVSSHFFPCLLLLLPQGKQSFKQLDNQLARLAVKLPQGDLAGQARALAAVQGGRDPNKTEEQQEEDELL